MEAGDAVKNMGDKFITVLAWVWVFMVVGFIPMAALVGLGCVLWKLVGQ